MMKDIEQMSDHELLMELVKEKRRNDKLRYVKYGVYGIIALVVIILCIKYVPKLVAFFKEYNEVMNQLKQASDSVKKVSDSISSETIETFNDVAKAIKDLLGRFGIN